MNSNSFLVIGSAFLSGATISMWVPDSGWLAYALIGLFLSVPCVLIWPPGGMILLGFLSGLMLSLYSGLRVLDHHIQLPSDQREAEVLGLVESYPAINDFRTRFEFEVISSNRVEIGTGHRLLVSCYECDHQFKRGQQWHLKLKLKPPHGYASPGAFDYEKWLLRHRIHATAYVRETPLNALVQVETPNPVANLRQHLKTWLNAELLHDPYSVVIVQALLLGDRAGFDEDLWSTLRRTGVAHMFAISGLHVGLVWLFTSTVVRWVTRIFPGMYLKLPAQFIAGWSGVVVALAYAALSGWGVPVQRAILMLGLFQLNRSLGRRCCPYHGLLLVATLLLLLDPLVIMDIGFWLSCYAVLLLVYFTGDSGNRGWKGIASKQIKLNLFMAPLVLLFFSEVSLLSPLVNFVVVPLMGVLLLPALLLTVSFHLMGLETIAVTLLQSISVGFNWLILGLQKVAALPFSAYQGSFWVGLFGAILLGLLVLFRYDRRIAIVGAALVGLVAIPSINDSRLQDGEYAVHVLDVGQGLSVVVQTRNKTLLYDTGARYNNGGSAAAAVVIPWLLHHGVRYLDYLVISHTDNDHIGGLEDVVSAMEILAIHVSVESLWRAGATDCHAIPAFTVDGVRMEYLHADIRYETTNNQSCVLKITGASGSFLLTGDIEKLAEGNLVNQYGSQLNSEVMLVPHHGSRTSSRPVFIDAVAPEEVVISSGFLNSYGHPADSVVSRYLERGVSVTDTPSMGTLSYLFVKDGLQVDTYRRTAYRYWW